MSYLSTLQQVTNKTARTENGALTNESTLDPVLDFFAQAGAMRGRIGEAVRLFQNAYDENPELAVRALFYLRDVRGGQGERDIFRACVQALPLNVQHKITKYIPEYGRWDDLFSLDVRAEAYDLIRQQFIEDYANMRQGKSISLLAKWLPSENTSSRATRKLAHAVREQLELTPAQYRRGLSKLRKHIDVLERKMSANQWSEVNYPNLPSQAHRKHTDAFNRHDDVRYQEYLESVKKGEAQIKTSTLYTYEVFDMVRAGREDVADVMWNNLPDYTQGKNAIVLADVSGSMLGRPMSISVSLALYFAERNVGPFKGYFLTFSARPQLVKVRGTDLKSKLRNIESQDWAMNTNVEAAFRAILDAAVKKQATQEEIPAVLYIISDMEFDAATRGHKTNLENAEELFAEAGYKLPHVVFWNVNSRNNQSPATKYDGRVSLISGSSQSTFRYAVEGKTPIELMESILNGERYSQITL